MLGLFSSRDKFIDQVTAGLSACLATRITDNRAPTNLAPVFISKWVDYSNKFGFGFQLSNGCVGVLFNDSTKIGTTPDAAIVEFTDMKGKTFSFPWDDNANQPFPELNHRVSLLKYYIQYMDENLADSLTFLPGTDTVNSGQKSAVPQLTRWNRRGDYVAMELNTQLVQVNHMTNHEKVMIWAHDGDLVVTLISTTSSRTFSLSSACPASIRSKLEDTLLEVKELTCTKGTGTSN